MESLDEIRIIPKTLDDAVGYLEQTISDEDRAEFVAMEHDAAMAECHHGAGQWIRNAFKLWDRERPLRQWFEEVYHLDHPDDMSHLILSSLWCDLRGVPRRVDKELGKIRAYWRETSSS